MKRVIKKIFSMALILFVLVDAINLVAPVTKASTNCMTEDESMLPEVKAKISEILMSLPNKTSLVESVSSDISEPMKKAMSISGTSPNLIVNGDFEQELSSYGTWAAYHDTSSGEAIFTWDSQIYHGSGGHSIQIQGTDTFASCVNGISILPGREYSFSAWGKALNVSKSEDKIGFYIYIGQYNNNGDAIENTEHFYVSSEATFDWEQVTSSFISDSNAAMVFIILGLNGSGTVWYDDVSLTESAPAIIPVDGITLSTPSATITARQTQQLTATVSPANATNKNVVWSVQNQSSSNVVTVSSDGMVTALNPGTAVIRAACEQNPDIYADCSIAVIEPKYTLLPANAVISDTVTDPTLPVLYAVDSNNSKLYAVNYETKSLSEITFNLKPERVAYSNGKLYVTLLKMQHNSYVWDEQQNGAIAIVSAADLTMIKQFDVATDPFDIDVSGQNIFVSSGSGQWTKINCYSETSGQTVSSSSIRQQSYMELNPVLNRLYTIDTDTSQRDFTAYDINNGIFTGSHDSPYHGDYSMSYNFRITPDGKYVVNGSGLILTCDADVTKDLQFAFMLNKPFSDIAFDIGNNKFYTAVQGKTIYSYDYSTFIGTGVLSSEGEISSLYSRDNKLIALSKLNENQYIVEAIDTSGSSVISPPEVSTIQLQKEGSRLLLNYSITDSIKDSSNPVIFITDSSNKKIASINYETGTAKELVTYYTPGRIAYSNGEIYVGYGSQGIIGIYDAQTLVLKDYIYTGATFFDLNIGSDGFIYTSSGEYARSYSRTSKQEVSRLYVFHYGSLEMHPLFNTIYFTSMYVSPSDLYALKYSNGNLTSQYDSPYHGDYSMSYNNRISPDGKYIFNGSGEVFYGSQNKLTNLNGTYDNPNTDLAHAFCLNNGTYNDIAFDLDNSRFFTGNSSGITSFDYSSFKPVNYAAAAGEVLWLHNISNQLLAVEKKDNSYFIEVIEKSEFGALPTTSPTPTYSNMPIFTSQNAANATEISAETTISGSFQGNNYTTWYKFNAVSNGTYTVTYPQNARSMTVFNNDGFEVAFKMYSGNLTVRMEAGKTYYLAIANYYSSGNYTFSIMLDTPVTGITLNKPSASIYVGSSEQLTATVTPQTGDGKIIIWSVQSQSAANVAAVSSNGLVTAISPGTAVIRAAGAADPGVYDECTITVLSPVVLVKEVTLNKAATAIIAGQAEQLTAAVVPSNVVDKGITWSIFSQSSSNVVAISSTGLVTAINPGTAVVRATSNADNTKYASCSVTVINESGNSGGIINTFAGSDSYGYSGDGGPATSAWLYCPMAVAADGSGNIYIADYHNHRIRKVSTNGTISTVAGTGIAGNSGDGGPAESAQLYYPQGLALDNSGNLYIADVMNQNIRKVSPNGVINTVAGTGNYGYSGDGGLAVSAELGSPSGVAVDGNGNIFIADYANSRIRKIGSNGIISTVVGTGVAGHSGDGGQAASAKLNCPRGITFDSSGNMYIADSYNNRIRKVDSSGIITTIAGTGTYGYSGDGGTALSAQLRYPTGLSVDSSGNIYIADQQNNRVRKVDTQGIIATIAGTGATSGYLGDGGAACSAQLFNPSGVVVDGSGNLYIADSNNNRIRKVAVSSSGQTPAEIAVTGITLNKNAATLAEGQAEQLNAVVEPSNATNKNVTWTVVSQSSGNVITVSQTGLITAVSTGTAVIRAVSVSNPSKYAQCNITVVPVATPPTYEKDVWTTKTGMSTARSGAGVVELNGKIYVIGGSNNSSTFNKLEIYDPASDTWTTGCDMPTSRHGLKVVALNGKLYAIGGYSNGTDLNTLEMYDPVTDTWTSKIGMENSRCQFGAAAVKGKIYVVGGKSSGVAVNSIEEYDPVLDKWTIKGDMPGEYSGYYNMGSVEFGGELYLIGGDQNQGGSYSRSKKVMTYNPITGVWTGKADMPTSRYALGASSLNGFIYVIGGMESSITGGTLATVEEYNPQNDTWNTKLNMQTARYYLGVATALGKIYAIGGFDNSTVMNTVEEFIPEQQSTPVSVPVTAISLNKSSITMKQAQTEQLTVSVLPSNTTDKSVAWFVLSQNPGGVATVSSTGLVAALKPGVAVIRVRSNTDTSKYADCSITVTETVASDFDLDTVPNNTLKLGDDLFDMNSDAMKEPDAATAIASLLKDGQNKNKAYFKFGGKWYAPFELTQQQFLDPAYALTPEQVSAIKGFGEWYKAGSEIVGFTQGSYNISQINEFTAAFTLKADNVQGAAYFNIYRKSNNTLINSVPVAINSELTSMPAVFSNTKDIEVWLYSDAEGKNRVAVLKLVGNAESGTLTY